jgi:hypothetical protein
MVIFIENMKYKKIAVVLPEPLSGACRQGKEECMQEAGRNQAGGRKQTGGRQGVAVAGQSVPGQQELV